MARIYWYYADTGPGQLGDILSHMGGVKAEVRAKAESGAARAATILDTKPRVRTGDSQVGVASGDVDSYVYLSDPNQFKAAWRIEERFGALAGAF